MTEIVVGRSTLSVVALVLAFMNPWLMTCMVCDLHLLLFTTVTACVIIRGQRGALSVMERTPIVALCIQVLSLIALPLACTLVLNSGDGLHAPEYHGAMSLHWTFVLVVQQLLTAMVWLLDQPMVDHLQRGGPAADGEPGAPQHPARYPANTGIVASMKAAWCQIMAYRWAPRLGWSLSPEVWNMRLTVGLSILGTLAVQGVMFFLCFLFLLAMYGLMWDNGYLADTLLGDAARFAGAEQAHVTVFALIGLRMVSNLITTTRRAWMTLFVILDDGWQSYWDEEVHDCYGGGGGPHQARIPPLRRGILGWCPTSAKIQSDMVIGGLELAAVVAWLSSDMWSSTVVDSLTSDAASSAGPRTTSAATPWPLQLLALHRVARCLVRWSLFRWHRAILVGIPERHDISGADHGHCVICQEDFVEGVSVRELPCRHLLHSSCLRRWLATSPMCPICRASPWPRGFERQMMHADATVALGVMQREEVREEVRDEEADRRRRQQHAIRVARLEEAERWQQAQQRRLEELQLQAIQLQRRMDALRVEPQAVAVAPPAPHVDAAAPPAVRAAARRESATRVRARTGEGSGSGVAEEGAAAAKRRRTEGGEHKPLRRFARRRKARR